MRFKEFLLLEFGLADSGSDWFYGSFLLPSDAFDCEDAIHEPPDFKFLQSRWKRERKAGRKFHNLDLDKVLATKFVSIDSPTMPEAGEGGWKNRPDRRPNLRVDNDTKMKLIGTKKRGADPAAFLGKEHINDGIDLKDRLNKLFGRFEPSYYELPKDFDQPWTNRR